VSDDEWSAVAGEWVQLWGGFAEPVWRAILAASNPPAGAWMLDVGCGGGNFLSYGRERGLRTIGTDPAPGMLELARTKADSVVRAEAAHLPWPNGSFDLVTAINALQFAEDTDEALAEMVRVSAPGSHVAVANWAERALNDLDTVERALDDGPPGPDGPDGPDGDLRVAGGLEELFEDSGLKVAVSGLVEMPWEVPDDATLVRGILLGDDPALASDVLAAAAAYRTESGGYRLVNHFRYAVGCPRA
jgi:SAM-dependent methyltransferase